MQSSKPIQFGRYELLGLLAKGGMGEVYLARFMGAAGFEKRCVIKKILPDLARNEKFVQKFINEGRTLVSLTHSNIVQIFDMGKVGDEYYLAMEHVAGSDLRNILLTLKAQNAFMPIGIGLYIISECLNGLSYAHRRCNAAGERAQVIHRDVSPSNLLLSTEGEVKLIDFGIAKDDLRQSESLQGVVQGKFAYMSPEQARGELLDERSDLFSCGVMMYEILAGDRPFVGNSDLQNLELIKIGNFAKASTLRPQVDAGLESILARALCVEPSERYQTADEFLQAIARYEEAEGVLVRQREVGEYVRGILDASKAVAFHSVDDFLNHEFGAKLRAQASFEGEARTQSLHFTQSFSQRIPNASTDDFVHNRSAERLLASLGVGEAVGVAAVQTQEQSRGAALEKKRSGAKRRAVLRLLYILVGACLACVVLYVIFVLRGESALVGVQHKQGAETGAASKKVETSGKSAYFSQVLAQSDADTVPVYKAGETEQRLRYRFILHPEEASIYPAAGRIERLSALEWGVGQEEPASLEISAQGYDLCVFLVEFPGPVPQISWNGCEMKFLPSGDPGVQSVEVNMRASQVESLPKAPSKPKADRVISPKQNKSPEAKFSVSANVDAVLSYANKNYPLPQTLEQVEGGALLVVEPIARGGEHVIAYRGRANLEASSLAVSFCRLNIVVRESYLPGDPAPVQLADIYINDALVSHAADRLQVLMPCGKQRVSLRYTLGSASIRGDEQCTLKEGKDYNLALGMK